MSVTASDPKPLRNFDFRSLEDAGMSAPLSPWLSSRKARHFDLAVRMRDFTPGVEGQLAALAAFAPDHVLIAAP